MVFISPNIPYTTNSRFFVPHLQPPPRTTDAHGIEHHSSDPEPPVPTASGQPRRKFPLRSLRAGLSPKGNGLSTVSASGRRGLSPSPDPGVIQQTTIATVRNRPAPRRDLVMEAHFHMKTPAT